MRKYYVYAMTLLFLAVFLWLGYYFYMEYRPINYENGTFVELPNRNMKEEQEFSA